MDSNKQIAAGLTFLIGVCILIWLLLAKLGWTTVEPDLPDPYIEMAMADPEEFIEVEVIPPPPVRGTEASAPAKTDEPLDNDAKPAPVTGVEHSHQGRQGEPKQTVTTNRTSPVQVEQKPQPEKPGNPAKEKEDAERALAKATNNKLLGAFDASKKNQANNKKADNGKAGNPNGRQDSNGPANSTSKRSGSARGTVGGGWQMPSYSRNIPSNELGSVTFEVEVNADGSIGKITEIGGSGLTSATKAACRAEIKKHRFTPKNGASTTAATARITFTFADPK